MQSNTLASESIALHMICTTHGCVWGGERFSLHRDEHSLGCRPEKASLANERPTTPRLSGSSPLNGLPDLTRATVKR